MTSRDLFELEHGDTGVALLPRRASCGARVCSVDYTHGAHVHTEWGIRLDKVKAESASAPHSDRDGSEAGSRSETWAPRTDIPGGNVPARGAETIVTDERTKRLISLSRWERAGMLAYVAATFPQVFDETYDALGLGS